MKLLRLLLPRLFAPRRARQQERPPSADAIGPLMWARGYTAEDV